VLFSIIYQKNKNNLIQIIGRALRKLPEKTYAQIIISFSKSEDENARPGVFF